MFNWVLFLFLGTFAWGSSLFFIKLLLTELTPYEIALYRILLGTLTIWMIIFFKKTKINVRISTIQDGIIFGIFNMSIPFFLISYAEQVIDSSIAAIINSLTPLITFILSFLVTNQKDKFSISAMLSIILGFIGGVFIYSQGSGAQPMLWTWRLFFLLGACFSYALAALYTRHVSRTKEPLVLSAYAAFTSSVIMFIIVFLNQGSPESWNIPSSPSLGFSLLWLGAVSSGLASIIYVQLIQNWGAARASTITYLMTFTGVFLGVTILEEPLNNNTLIGSICIIASLLLLNSNFGKWVKFHKGALFGVIGKIKSSGKEC